MLIGPVAPTALGHPVQHAAVVEFDSINTATEIFDSMPEYKAALAAGGIEKDEATSSTVPSMRLRQRHRQPHKAGHVPVNPDR